MLTKQEEEDLAQDLILLLRQLNPEEALRANHWTCAAEQAGDDLYAVFTFFDLQPDPLNPRGHSVSISVQVSPQVRVVQLNFNMNTDGSNG